MRFDAIHFARESQPIPCRHIERSTVSASRFIITALLICSCQLHIESECVVRWNGALNSSNAQLRFFHHPFEPVSPSLTRSFFVSCLLNYTNAPNWTIYIIQGKRKKQSGHKHISPRTKHAWIRSAIIIASDSKKISRFSFSSRVYALCLWFFSLFWLCCGWMFNLIGLFASHVCVSATPANWMSKQNSHQRESETNTATLLASIKSKTAAVSANVFLIPANPKWRYSSNRHFKSESERSLLCYHLQQLVCCTCEEIFVGLRSPLSPLRLRLSFRRSSRHYSATRFDRTYRIRSIFMSLVEKAIFESVSLHATSCSFTNLDKK